MTVISQALDHLLRATGDPVADLAEVGPRHPRSAEANAIRAAAGVLAKVPAAFPAIERAVAQGVKVASSARVCAHLAAAQSWIEGEPEQAARQYEAIVQRWPRNLLALRLALSCHFFLGRMDASCALVDETLLAWREKQSGFGFVLAMASFAYAEAGHWERAASLGRRALARDPRCPMGVHAMAHALEQSGNAREAARWMRAQREHWAVPSRMLTHNAWHLALFDLAAGDVASAIAVADGCLLPAAHTSPVDACDATLLLSRIEAEGVAMGERWSMLSSAFERSWQPGFWPYVDLQAALAHRRAGQTARWQALRAGVERRARGTDGIARRARTVTVPALQALEANAAGAALDGLDPAGGSRIQAGLLVTLMQGHRDGASRPDTALAPPLSGGSHDNHHSAAA